MTALTVIFAIVGGILDVLCLAISGTLVIKDRGANQWGWFLYAAIVIFLIMAFALFPGAMN